MGHGTSTPRGRRQTTAQHNLTSSTAAHPKGGLDRYTSPWGESHSEGSGPAQRPHPVDVASPHSRSARGSTPSTDVPTAVKARLPQDTHDPHGRRARSPRGRRPGR